MHFIGLRHGQSTYNLQQLCNDDPYRAVVLTALGRRQADGAIEALACAGLTAIHCSPLPRAVETAQRVNRRFGLPMQQVDALADIRSGFDGRPVAEYFAAIAHDPLYASANGGESLHDHYLRVTAYLDHLLSSGADGVLLVAHEETLRVFAAWSTGRPLSAVVGKSFENCRPYHFCRD